MSALNFSHPPADPAAPATNAQAAAPAASRFGWLDLPVDAILRFFSNPLGMISACTFALVGIGLVMVYSASAPVAYR
ncbi:MAG TPA: hypothetical protein VL860_04015, partial [Planctomycetota bacterium]|nr:hypothetical protein [Planctomycetota bacterium]